MSTSDLVSAERVGTTVTVKPPVMVVPRIVWWTVVGVGAVAVAAVALAIWAIIKERKLREQLVAFEQEDSLEARGPVFASWSGATEAPAVATSGPAFVATPPGVGHPLVYHAADPLNTPNGALTYVPSPDAQTGDVMSLLNGRRGKVGGMNPLGDGRAEVSAQVPQVEMYSFPIDLRAATQGRGRYTMTLSHYEEVPHNVAEQIISAHSREHAAASV